MAAEYMMGGGSFGMGFTWFLYLALAAFIFGIIFWWTRTLVEKRK